MRALHLALLALAGCATAGNFQRADTLGKGTWALGADLSGQGIIDSGEYIATVPLPRLTARGGVHDKIDLGGSLGVDGVRAQAKFQLAQSDVVTFSIAPGLRWLPLPENRHLAGFEQVLLLGVSTSDRTQLVFTLKGEQDLGIVEGRINGVIPYGGGTIGISIDLSDRVRLMPEVGMMVPLLVFDQDQNLDLPTGLLPQGGAGINYRF